MEWNVGSLQYFHSVNAIATAIEMPSTVEVVVMAALPSAPVLSGSPCAISAGSGSAMSGMSLALQESPSQKQTLYQIEI